MLEGLEVSEIKFSRTYLNKDFRTDSDFWTREPYRNPNIKYEPIGKILSKAQYGISVSMNEDEVGYPIYRMNEIHNMMCDLNVLKFADISKEDFKKFKLNDRDVLFNRTNSYEWVGRTGLFRELENTSFTFASYLVRFIPDERYVLPEYLTTFLNTKYGILDIKRRSRQSINQTNVNPEEVKEIFIPLLNSGFQKLIKENFEKAHVARIKTQELYTQAETLLLEALGLQDFSPSQEPVNVKSFKESFVATGRLDAEYYQRKYEDYEMFLRKHRNGFSSFAEVCTVNDKNYTPSDTAEYKYIELANIGKSGEIKDCTFSLGAELPSRARRKVNTNDIIISTIEGSLESCALIPKEYDGALCSTGFFVVRSKILNPETLLVLFKSEPMQNLLKKGCSGTILTAISKTTLEQIPVPLIESHIQQEIKEKISESFRLRQQSEQLLELAKRAVEVAVEEGEERGMEVLNNNL